MEPETGRQLLREAEPYDDKKVYCHKSKGKKVSAGVHYSIWSGVYTFVGSMPCAST
jgi:hypothetical protein